ncbi:Dihydroneopterin aldolase [Propionibacterium freudenreichii]|nr:Dihydroneopterin aldolase [Propionibacterium freudenreichii]
MSVEPEMGFVVVSLSGITAMGHHGVLESERREGQPFSVDLRLVAPEPGTDELSEAVNYAEVAELVSDLIRSQAVNLIETLAARIADAVVELPRVREVDVTVHKPHASIPVPFNDVTVTVNRRTP